MATKIEWCHETWNPVTGCTAISEGCKNCYARRMAQRLKGRCGYPKDDPFRVTFHPDRLNQPLKWKKPRMIFVCSMGDLFHSDVKEWQLDRVFDRILYDGISHHIWMVLTKRPERMVNYFKSLDNPQSSFENVWIGVTVESPEYLDRIDTLLKIQAAVHFVSIEPMLAPVDLNRREFLIDKIRFKYTLGTYLDWVIVGPETGPGKRECKPEWIRDLYDQCQSANVPFFDKSKTNWLSREFPINVGQNTQP